MRMKDYSLIVCIALLLVAALVPVVAFSAPAAEDEDADAPAVVEVKPVVVPQDLTMRARILKITPSEPTAINWRYGGEGLGGEVVSGTLAEKVNVGEWSPVVPLTTFGRASGKRFLTLTMGNAGRPASRQDRTKVGYSTGLELELEFSYKGKVIKTLKEAGPDGGTIGLVIPYYRLAGKEPTDPEFLGELTGVLAYATRRAEQLEKLSWADGPVPRKYAILTNAGGYGVGSGRGVRTTDKAVVAAEVRSLRQLGVNGLRAGPDFLQEMAATRSGFGKDLHKGMITNAPGFPVPRYKEGSKRNTPEDGCPYAPGVAQRTQGQLEEAEGLFSRKTEEVWALTVDEIGSVVNLSPQRRDHLSVCAWCNEGFREYLKAQGIKPGDFGKQHWDEIKPLSFGPAKQSKSEKGAKKPVEAEGTVAAEKAGPETVDLTGKVIDARTGLLAYYSDMFNNHVTARLFTPLRDFIAQRNDAKRKALDAGQIDSPAARQPWVYSYALRRNSFLMGDGFPDFFDFYRLADNGFVYETSNRGAHVWSWDSYLCDVGRIVSGKTNVRFGIYVKPHRGAVVQRALTACSRGARMLYWYTYGPDYSKGDSFSQNPVHLELTSKAAHLIGKAEDALYGASWAQPAQVAVVNPRSSSVWMRLSGGNPAWQAAWENAKWTYTALAHAHIPVDPLDEVMLATEDLSKYKVIYVSGPNITRAAAKKLAEWVHAGGVLYTSGYGLSRDEANQPLWELDEALGLAGRNDPEMYFRITLYGATQIQPFDARGQIQPVPDAAAITGSGPMKGSFKPVVGREVLQPKPGTQVLARFADGSAAATCRSYGKGQAYVVGFYPGLEYSATVRMGDFDMSKDFDAARRAFVAAPALAVVQPVVAAEQPAVEGVLLKNDSTGKRCVTLMNWAYKVAGHKRSLKGKREVVSPVIGLATHTNLKVTIRGAGEVGKVTSAWTGQVLAMSKDGEAITVTVPTLEEGDVLLLE